MHTERSELRRGTGGPREPTAPPARTSGADGTPALACTLPAHMSRENTKSTAKQLDAGASHAAASSSERTVMLDTVSFRPLIAQLELPGLHAA